MAHWTTLKHAAVAVDISCECLEARVKGHRSAKDVIDNVRVVVQALVHHKAEDAHLGGAAVVELNATLLQLGLLVEGVPAEVNESIAEVTHELGLASHVFHHEELHRG